METRHQPQSRKKNKKPPEVKESHATELLSKRPQFGGARFTWVLGGEILEGTPKDPLKKKYIYIYRKSDGVIFNGSGGHDDHTMWDYKFCWPGAVQEWRFCLGHE